MSPQPCYALPIKLDHKIAFHHSVGEFIRTTDLLRLCFRLVLTFVLRVLDFSFVILQLTSTMFHIFACNSKTRVKLFDSWTADWVYKILWFASNFEAIVTSVLCTAGNRQKFFAKKKQKRFHSKTA